MTWEQVPKDQQLDVGDRMRHFYQIDLPDFYGVDDFIAEVVANMISIQREVNSYLPGQEEIEITNVESTENEPGIHDIVVEYEVIHTSPLAVSLTTAAIVAGVSAILGFLVGITFTGAEKFVAGAGIGAVGVAALGLFVLSKTGEDE